MSTELATIPINQYLSQPEVSKYLTQLLGERKGQFVVAMTTIVNGNKALLECDQKSLTAVGLTAVGMNLSMSPSLGHCYPVPYRNQDGSKSAQFQMGWKGFIQLALRTGQYRFINVSEVYQNQFVSFDKFNEVLNADFTVDGKGKIVGYVAKFILNSGFQKTLFWKTEAIQAHGRKYSKSYDSGQWTKDFDGMARKTVLKQLVSKFGLMSTELEEAITKDQAILERDYATGEEIVRYEDNPQEAFSKAKDVTNDDYVSDACQTIEVPVPTSQSVAKAYAKPTASNTTPGSYVLQFGNKHKGKTLVQIMQDDPTYLDWVATKSNAYDDVKTAVNAYLHQPKTTAYTAPTPPTVSELFNDTIQELPFDLD